MIHQPKGGMCMSCHGALQSCAHLDFSAMREIFRYPDGVIVVRCTEFNRQTQPGAGD